MTVNKKNAGRPKIKIDWKEFDNLCLFQCTLKEISHWFDCSEDTIRRRCHEETKLNFETLYKKKSVGGKISLRRAQFKSAESGNSTMLVWLGKQYLGQTDKREIEDTTENKAQPVEVIIKVEDAS